MEIYLPDIYQKSIYTIDYSKLLNRGIKCLLYDLDNTIAPGNSKEVTKKTKDLFTSLKQKGFKVCIFSNSPKFRTKIFTSELKIDGISSAGKPYTWKLRRFLKNNGYDKSEVAIIGDQLMTDIKVGNKVGITTILVNPVSERDFLFTRFNRFFEEKKMAKLTDKKLFHKGRFYD